MTANTNGRVPDDVRGAASYYIGLGLVPIPVPRRGKCKEPALKGWQSLRPRAEDVDGLFPDEPPCNLGLLTGSPSGGTIDVDLDAPEAVAAAPWLLPPTGWCFGRESKPKSHWLYGVEGPPDKAVDPYRDVDGKMLLELHSTGWQVIAPPSTHYSGEPVLWHRFTEPGRVGWAELQTAAREVAACALLARHWPAVGSRQDCFLALAGGLLRGGWEGKRAVRFLHALAKVTRDEEADKRVATVEQTERKLAQNDPVTGWPTLAELMGGRGESVTALAREWLLGDGGAAPAPWPEPVPLGEVPAVPPFPVEVLPGPMRRLVEEIAWALNCPPDFAGVPLLALAGGAVANARHLAVTPSHAQPPCLFAAVISPPGTAKSPALKLLRRPFDEAQRRHLDAWRARMDAWKDQEPEERGPRPVLQRCVVSDVTTESLGLILSESPRGVAMVRDELSGLVAGLNQYKGGKGHDRQVYLALWSGDTLVIDRKSDKSRDGAPLYVTDPFAAIVGGTQPDVFDRMRGDGPRAAAAPDDGFLDRFLLVFPATLPAAGETWRQVSPEALAAWQGAVGHLLGLEMAEGEHGPRPFYVNLSASGRRAWQRFTEAHAAEVNAEGFLPHLVGPWSKLKGYAARLALVLYCLDGACSGAWPAEVDGPCVERAVALVSYFKAHALKAHALLGADPKAGEARRLVRWLKGKGLARFSKREAFQALRGTFKRVEDLDGVLAVLEKHGYVRPETQPLRAGPGRRPSPVFEAHPSLLGEGELPSESDPQSPHNTQNGPPQGHSEYCEGSGGDLPADEGLGPGAPEHAPAAPPTAAHIPQNTQNAAPAPHSEYSEECEEGPCATAARPVEAQFRLVRAQADLPAVLAAIEQAPLVAVDVETTGLDPRRDRLRLLSVAGDGSVGSRFCYLIDGVALVAGPVAQALSGRELVLHNALFDLGFLSPLGLVPGVVHDTMLYSQLLYAGTDEAVSLAACARRELGVALDKREQKSDWSGALSPEQLSYAARDAAILPPLIEALRKKLEAEGLARVAEVERRSLPAVAWLAGQGVPFDSACWGELARDAGDDAARLRRELDEAAPPRPERALFPEPWNWNSPEQVRRALALAGCPAKDTADASLAALGHPLAELLRAYREASKRASAYGRSWLRHVRPDGRCYPGWRQLGAVTGRMSCRTPNLQQLPRGACRRCVAAPPGRALVKADFSQLHLRVIAGVAPEPAMQEAFRQGADLHALTARRLTGAEEVSKEQRQRAKACAFGLCYGMGASRFRAYANADYGLDLTEEEAAALRRGFFGAYPGLRAWHRRQADGAVSVRAPSGRLCRGVAKFSDKLAYRILLTEADCLKGALALLWERRDQAPGAAPVLACHDEVVVECDRDLAEQAEAWLVGAMLDAAAPLLAPVPAEVAASVGTTWGGAELRGERAYRKEG